MRVLLLLLLALAAAGPYTDAATAAETSRPSDTNNKPATPPTPAPPPGQTPKPPAPPGPPPGQPPPPPSSSPPPTPAPAPSSASPSSSPPPPPSSAPPASSTPPTSESPSTPEPTTATVVSTTAPLSTPAAASSNTSSSSADASSGMGAGAIVGIVLACVGLIAIIAFFAYRHFRARRADAQGYGMGDYGGQSPVLESSRAQHDAKMYASLDLPKPSRQTTATPTPPDDIVIMATYVTPSSPKFTDSAPQLSPPSYHQHNNNQNNENVADFTQPVNTTFDQSRAFDQSRGPGASVAASSDFGSSYREGSYAASYAESYAGGTSFMNSYDNGILGGDGFRDTLDEGLTTTPLAAAKKTSPSNGLAGLDTAKDDSHWMDAMDEMRDTNDSYAMLEAGGGSGSFNSRGSAMRFSTESDLHG